MKREETSIPNTEFTTATGNFDTERQHITQIIIHSTVGTVQSAINRFGQKGSKVSAHYIISNDGKLYQGLEEFYTAFHSGSEDINYKSIGIEHEWYQGLTPSDTLYQTSAKLVADICKFYGLGVNRGVIKGHKEIVPTACPNAIDVDRIVKQAQEILTPTPIPDPCKTYIEQLNVVNASLASLTAEKNSLAVQLGACQRDKDTYKEAYDKLPELQENIKYLEGLKEEWVNKETEYGKRIKYLETKIEKIKTPIKSLLVEILEAIKK